MATVRDLISSSLRKLSILGAGENLTAEDATDGLNSLNQMLSSWSADGQVIFSRSVDSIPLTSGLQTYTMGIGGAINTARPAGITQATINLGSTVYMLNIWNSNVISTQGFPTLQGIPSDIYVNNGNPLLTLQLYPVPIGGLTLNIYSMKPLSSLALNDTVDLPPGFEEAIIYNLAVRIAPEYDREASQTVKEMASESKGVIMRNNQQYSQAVSAVDEALNPRYMNGNFWGYNIYGGH
jgi:hypothetical protein